MSVRDYVFAARRDYELAHAICNKPERAAEEAREIHPQGKWSNSARWQEAVAKTGAQLLRVSRKVVESGQEATYLAVIDGKRFVLGCNLLDPSEQGYVVLYEAAPEQP